MTEPHTTQQQPAPRPLADDEISLWEVLAVLLRRRVTIVSAVVVVSVLSVATGFIGGPKFTSAAAFRPQGSALPGSDLLALAGQFGVNVGGALSEEATPAFYQELLTSREILLRAARPSYALEGLGETDLVELLEIEEATPEIELEEVLEWLEQEAVSVSTSTTTGTVTLAVQTNWPDLSQAIARNLLEEVTRFNMDTRQSQARAEREFIEARVDSVEAELRTAEADLRGFLETNRLWQGSPLLELQHDRLQRDVTLKQSVLTTLVQSFEQARIAERRDTPVVTVLQEPYLPPERDPRGTVLRAAIGVVLGGLLGVILAFVLEAVRSPATGDPGRRDFQESWDAFVRSIPIVGRGRARAAARGGAHGPE